MINAWALEVAQERVWVLWTLTPADPVGRNVHAMSDDHVSVFGRLFTALGSLPRGRIPEQSKDCWLPVSIRRAAREPYTDLLSPLSCFGLSPIFALPPSQGPVRIPVRPKHLKMQDYSTAGLLTAWLRKAGVSFNYLLIPKSTREAWGTFFLSQRTLLLCLCFHNAPCPFLPSAERAVLKVAVLQCHGRGRRAGSSPTGNHAPRRSLVGWRGLYLKSSGLRRKSFSCANPFSVRMRP